MATVVPPNKSPMKLFLIEYFGNHFKTGIAFIIKEPNSNVQKNLFNWWRTDGEMHINNKSLNVYFFYL